jgi:hypothetical protein
MTESRLTEQRPNAVSFMLKKHFRLFLTKSVLLLGLLSSVNFARNWQDLWSKSRTGMSPRFSVVRRVKFERLPVKFWAFQLSMGLRRGKNLEARARMATFEGKVQRSDSEIDVLECDFRRLATDFVRLVSDFTAQLSVVGRMSELTAGVSGLKTQI